MKSIIKKFGMTTRSRLYSPKYNYELDDLRDDYEDMCYNVSISSLLTLLWSH